MSVKIFNVSLPSKLLEIIDNQAKLNYSTRSEYVKQAIITRLKSENAFDESVPTRTFHDLQRDKLKKFLEEYKTNNPGALQ